jgi:hypothetical protein
MSEVMNVALAMRLSFFAARWPRVAASSVPPRQYPTTLTSGSPVAFSTADSAARAPSVR